LAKTGDLNLAVDTCAFRTFEWESEEAHYTLRQMAAASPDLDEAKLSPVLIVTTNDVPGYRITKVHSDVFGITVRARTYFSNFGAQLRTLVGGEVAGYTKLLAQSRDEARVRLMDAARATGANAVVAFRFDCNDIGNIMTEIAAYGTAVTVEPSGSEAPAPDSRSDGEGSTVISTD
jgi:uncharacterized protein YbjQ (UPF0145 family)